MRACRKPRGGNAPPRAEAMGVDDDGDDEISDAPAEMAWPPWEEPEEMPAEGSAALQGRALIKEVCRLIRAARAHWDAHHNGAARLARRRALALYERLSPEARESVPQVLRVWLRYRSEKYYGARPGPRKKGKRVTDARPRRRQRGPSGS